MTGLRMIDVALCAFGGPSANDAITSAPLDVNDVQDALAQRRSDDYHSVRP